MRGCAHAREQSCGVRSLSLHLRGFQGSTLDHQACKASTFIPELWHRS